MPIAGNNWLCSLIYSAGPYFGTESNECRYGTYIYILRDTISIFLSPQNCTWSVEVKVLAENVTE